MFRKDTTEVPDTGKDVENGHKIITKIKQISNDFFSSFVDWQKERMNLTFPDEHISINVKKLENIFKLQTNDFIYKTIILSR